MYLVVFKGFAGSGKSTLARALSHRLQWPLIDKDDMKDLLDGHREDSGRLAYDLMFNVARRQLRQGLSVVCDSPLTYRGLYEQARRIAAELGATLAVVECFCSDEEEWQRRIDGRKELGLPAHHQTDWAAFKSYRDQVMPQTQYQITNHHLTIDTVLPLESLLSEITAWLTDPLRP